VGENGARTGAGCRRVVVLLPLQLRFLVADPTGATKPHTCTLWLGCPNLRIGVLSAPAQQMNRVHVRISVPTLFMPTPLKRHYNTNFTHFEALGLA